MCDEWYSPECAQKTAYAALRIERNNVAQVEEACRANYIVAHPAKEGGGGVRLLPQCVMALQVCGVCMCIVCCGNYVY